MSERRSLRVGQGWDTHRLASGRRLVLGGVEIESELGLLGHSDADVLTHAIIDALLGAAGRDDIGTHFPDDDPRLAGADSIELLTAVVADLNTDGFEIVHVDTTVILERPKLAPYRDAIRRRLAAALGLDLKAINIKATTGEGMGPVGRGEGAVALAIATVCR